MMPITSPANSHSLFRSLAGLGTRGFLPLLVYASIAVLAAVLEDPVASRESLFLALWAALGVAVVTALGWPTTGRGRQLHWPVATSLLVVAAAWMGHHQPYRGATVSVVLLLGLCLAMLSAWQERQRPLIKSRVAQRSPVAGTQFQLLNAEITVPAALGFQLALRPGLLLQPYFELHSTVSLVLLPVVAGLALAFLAERFDPRRVALAGATALILGPGWNVTTTLALLALAAGSVYADDRRPTWQRWMAIAGWLTLPWLLGSVGLLFVVGGLALVVTPTAALLLLLATLAIGLGMPAARLKEQAILLFVAAAGMVPSALWVTKEGRWRMRHGALIALAAALIGEGPEALACGLALLALSAPVKGCVFEMQRAWTATVLLGTCLFAAYPWMWQEPRGALLRQLGIVPRGSDLILPFLLVVGLGSLLQLLRQLLGRRSPRTLWWVLSLLGIALLSGQQGVTVLRNSYQAVVLDDAADLYRQSFEAPAVRAVYLDSNMVHGLQLEPGTVVADVVLRDKNNRQLRSWPLRVGVHTAEWAVARPDIAARPGLQVPHHWVSQIAADGTFFSRRFRGRFEVAEPLSAAHLHIRRRPELPAEVQLVIYRLELRH